MKVTTVTATLRYSAEAKGAWRSIEVGAEATLTASDETWEIAQAELYQRLGQQLKVLWANGSSKPVLSSVEGSHAEIPPAQETVLAPTSEHWCTTHLTDYQRYTKGNKTWYSHRGPGGTWCKEPNK